MHADAFCLILALVTCVYLVWIVSKSSFTSWPVTCSTGQDNLSLKKETKCGPQVETCSSKYSDSEGTWIFPTWNTKCPLSGVTWGTAWSVPCSKAWKTCMIRLQKCLLLSWCFVKENNTQLIRDLIRERRSSILLVFVARDSVWAERWMCLL